MRFQPKATSSGANSASRPRWYRLTERTLARISKDANGCMWKAPTARGGRACMSTCTGSPSTGGRSTGRSRHHDRAPQITNAPNNHDFQATTAPPSVFDKTTGAVYPAPGPVDVLACSGWCRRVLGRAARLQPKTGPTPCVYATRRISQFWCIAHNPPQFINLWGTTTCAQVYPVYAAWVCSLSRCL